MNLEFTKITLPCPRCTQNVTTTIADLRLWPVLRCLACNHEFFEDFGPLIALASEHHSNLRDVRPLADADRVCVPVLDVRLNEGH